MKCGLGRNLQVVFVVRFRSPWLMTGLFLTSSRIEVRTREMKANSHPLCKWSHDKWSVLPFTNLGERLWHALQTELGSFQPTHSLKFKSFSNWIVWIIYCRWQECRLHIWMMAWVLTVFTVISPLVFSSVNETGVNILQFKEQLLIEYWTFPEAKMV